MKLKDGDKVKIVGKGLRLPNGFNYNEIFTYRYCWHDHLKMEYAVIQNDNNERMDLFIKWIKKQD